MYHRMEEEEEKGVEKIEKKKWSGEKVSVVVK
jgi:hypothetical protein